MSRVWVEQGDDFKVVCIFKSEKAAFAARVRIVEIDRALAVSNIRHQLYIRSGGFCDLCHCPISENTAHMHEMKHRGQGGLISLGNSVMACSSCHKYQHKDRSPVWSKKVLTSKQDQVRF